jgi:hypothetical protein
MVFRINDQEIFDMKAFAEFACEQNEVYTEMDGHEVLADGDPDDTGIPVISTPAGWHCIWTRWVKLQASELFEKAGVESPLARSPSLQRKWINQPSTQQVYHSYHGLNVLAWIEPEGTWARVWFTTNVGTCDTQSIRITTLALSEGWTKPRG